MASTADLLACIAALTRRLEALSACVDEGSVAVGSGGDVVAATEIAAASADACRCLLAAATDDGGSLKTAVTYLMVRCSRRRRRCCRRRRANAERPLARALAGLRCG